MKVLILDTDGDGLGIDLALRAMDWDHAVKYWMRPHVAGDRPYGQGLIEIVEDWELFADWADLIIPLGNTHYQWKLAEYFGRGYPIFGTNERSAELETDRARGQEVLDEHEIETLPYVVVHSVEDAVSHIAKTGKAFAIKPWGGTTDKAMTYVGSKPEDAIFTLEKWQREGKDVGQLMLQEKADGIEMGIAAWFGPGGFSRWKEESFEHKKFLVDDLGENTGEMGTVIRHVEKSKLFDKLLAPLEEYLQLLGYVGDCSINCIIDGRKAYPLEFTMRLGWPDFNIRQEVLPGDPVQWMLDLLMGKDTFEPTTDIAVGVLMAHGDFPRYKDPLHKWAGYPISGVTKDNEQHIHWQEVMQADAPVITGGKVKRRPGMATAGNYVAVVTGSGASVTAAAREAYAVADAVRWPSNVMYRTDISDRLKKELPLLQENGWAVGMKY